ncbi:papilin-like [Ruditapes philippinarum]|uniref:papilin-like n=1 Tax=Ruditapes philippinarum TaxID=129788 RepID=UPI00295C1921|nr:papilin-like [Ruditapes philippinarum]
MCVGKPGLCPEPPPFGLCVELCTSDSNCIDDYKCCPNGCGHTCQKPVLDCSQVVCVRPSCLNGHVIPEGECCPICRPEKPGICPELEDGGICLLACLIDNECPGSQKCCINGCKHTCETPLPETCPNGRNGSCGTIAGLSCPNDTTCMFKKDHPDAAGKCCIDKPKPIEVCVLPVKFGPCQDSVPRYFYNTTTCKCEEFDWGGCEPNDNNFFNLAYCQASCENPMYSNSVCELAQSSVDDCKTDWNLDRWYFNRTSCECEPFKWNGCGSANNFLTKEWCEINCGCYDCNKETNICNLPFNPIGTVVCSTHTPSYGYDTETCRCEKFIYGGCAGNANRFSTLANCEKHCSNNECNAHVFCDQPANPGTFDDNIPRYFYNTETCNCEKFIWGGSGGNSNNFKTREDCFQTCDGFNKCDAPVVEVNCLLPKETGPCQAVMSRFYFDHLDCKCKQFNYSGCGGNSNNFMNIQQCETSCSNTTCPFCNKPGNHGLCNGNFKPYFFNIQTCRCEQFVYGGCGGNENRYETKEECENICGEIQCPVCNLPPEKGNCMTELDLWYFDAVDCNYKIFKYSGCGGNMNRFLTEDDCKSSCGNVSCPVCSVPKQTESCDDHGTKERRFFYNPLKNKCQPFLWGGCQSNGNNFIKMKACKSVCKNFVCSLPVKIGPCEAAIERYYFNASTGECHAFLWGGCDPNGNNFKSLRQCRRACRKR